MSKAERRRAAREARLAAERAERGKGAKRKWLQIGAIALFAAVVVAVLVVVSVAGGGEENGGALESQAREVDELIGSIQQDGIALGDPDAPVTMTEFGDLQCPACKRYSEDVFPTLVDRFVRSGDLRMEFQPLTFIGPDSERAARMAAATSRQDRYWSFIDLFYREQQVENTGYVTDEFLTEIAGATPGVSAEKALEQRDSQSADRILSDANDLAAESAIDATPSFLIGPTGGQPGPLDVGSFDPDEFASTIENQLKEAKGR